MADLTIDDLVTELDDARQLARDANKPSAMISATLAKAKLLGLDTGLSHEDIAQPVKVVIQVKDASNPKRVLPSYS